MPGLTSKSFQPGYVGMQAVLPLAYFSQKNVEDFRHKLWDHLFLISDFKVDVKSPYPIPTRETLKTRPKPLPYPKRYPKYSHLGKNLEVVINKALKEIGDRTKKKIFARTSKRHGCSDCLSWLHKDPP